MFVPHPLYCFVSGIFLWFSTWWAAESFTEAVLESQFVWTDTLNTNIWMLVLATWNGCLWNLIQTPIQKHDTQYSFISKTKSQNYGQLLIDVIAWSQLALADVMTWQIIANPNKTDMLLIK